MPAPPAAAPAALFEVRHGSTAMLGVLLGERRLAELDEQLAAGAVVALAASRFTAPAGFVDARVAGGDDVARVRTLFVASAQRNRGIGTLLVRAIEERLRAAGCTAVEIVFARSDGAALPLDRVLDKCGWPLARKRSDVFRIDDPHPVLDERWMHIPLPSYFEIVPWTAVTTQELDGIREAAHVLSSHADYISPFIEDTDAPSSLALRYRGMIAGWMVNRRPRDDLIVFDRFYVHPRCRALRGGIPLLAESIRRYIANGAQPAIFLAPVHLERQYRLYHKLLGRHFSWCGEEWAAIKQLTPTTANRRRS
jgi:GNAT superfamily N-acetyltransferase